MSRNALVVMLVVLALLAPAARASRPVQKSGEGCVLDGQLYAFFGNTTVYRYTLTRPFDLGPYEGKRIELRGSLLPGDRFTPTGRRFKVLGPLTPELRRWVRTRAGAGARSRMPRVRGPFIRGQAMPTQDMWSRAPDPCHRVRLRLAHRSHRGAG